MERDTTIFWTPEKLLSYNKIFNIAIGSRGCGKSFSCKLWGIRDFIKNGNMFVYLRRTEAELDEVKNSFFRDVIKEGYFGDNKFSISGNEYYIDNKLAGFSQALSTAGKIKSNSFPTVNKVIFDEFLIDKSSRIGYMRDEPGMLLNLYETIDRGRDETRVIMLSNAMSIVNPYFNKWNVHLNHNAKFTRVGSEIIVEIVTNDKFLNWKKETRFGKFLRGTDEGRHMIDNEFVTDNYTFVEKIGGRLVYVFTCQYEGTSIGVWYSDKLGIFYCSYDTQKSMYNFAFSSADHRVNSIMFKTARSNTMMKNLMQAYDYGNVRYADIKIKSLMLQLFDYI